MCVDRLKIRLEFRKLIFEQAGRMNLTSSKELEMIAL